MNIIGNYVLVEPYWDAHYVCFANDRLMIDTSFEKGYYQPVRGRVLAVPKQLRYGDSVMLDWDTDMELRVGDEVVVNYSEIYSALHTFRRSYCEVDGKKALFVRYDKINIAKRDNEVVPVNGYVYIEPICSTTLDVLQNPYLTANARDRVFGVVRYVGSRNRRYFWSDKYIDDFDPPVGSVVGMKPFSDLYVEAPGNFKFLDELQLLKVQRPNIMSIVENIKTEVIN